MRFSDEIIHNLLVGELMLDLKDIPNTCLSDSFLDTEVDINFLKFFFKKAAFEQFYNKIQERKLDQNFTYVKCENAVVTDCIRCDRCLLWRHYLCVNLKHPNKALLSKISIGTVLSVFLLLSCLEFYPNKC
ncbi:hypothetical protein TSAR_000041 [Trichomalopsis sarcophagae]|uniref:Uncharacterized protein n=1 Tax=Trichomalopsis sarcophagae TaxID=543379 RepID=A0A232ELG7_9HYME|nr:hypothetical protein TSAR_000041 [Trichomalopsis sarcophagae]